MASPTQSLFDVMTDFKHPANGQLSLSNYSVSGSDLHRLLAAHMALESVFEDLNEDNVSGEKVSDKHQALLQRGHMYATYTRRHLLEIFGEGIVRAHPSMTSAVKARKVFHTVELLEMIVLKLNPYEILQMQQVDKKISQIIADSPVIKQRYTSTVDTNGFWKTPFAFHTFPGIHLSLFGEDGDRARVKNNRISLKVTFDVDKIFHRTPQVGSRFRSMFICQPPIKEILPTVSCCALREYNANQAPLNGRFPRPSKLVIPPVRNSNGVTVGNLIDATDRLKEEHRLCPFAVPGMLDAEGNVRARVEFSGPLLLRRNDPLLVRSSQPKEEEGGAEVVPVDATVEGYVFAKLTAHYENRPIPTLQQYKTELITHGPTW